MATGQGRGVVLGYLRYVLGFDSLAFQEGLGEADKRLKAAQKSISGTAAKIKGVGAILSVGVTAPIVGIGGAFTEMARNVANSVPELEKSAQLANAGFEDFQRLAYAAKSVGIESEKLSDIYKDVNDRVGEFLQTGSGEMKDFFEKIAPKVGVTAEQFRKLSGPEALQLYYNSLQKAGLSQQEMTFYLESMADEATALLPLLANNGEQMRLMGENAAIVKPEDAARMKEYVKAQQQMDTAFQNLTIALVGSGLLEKLTGFITKVAAWTSELAKTNPELLKWGAGIGAAAAAFGPALVGIGGIVSGFGKMLPLMMKIGPLFSGMATVITSTVIPVIATIGRALIGLAIAGGPLTLIVAAVAGAILVWKNWDTIGPIVQRMYQAVKLWVLDKLNAVWDSLKAKIDAVKKWFFNLYDAVVGHSYIPDMVDEIGQNMARLDALMVDPAAKATQSTGDKFREMATRVGGIMDKLFPQARALQNELADLAAIEMDTTLSPDAKNRALVAQRQRVSDARGAADEEAFPALEQAPGALENSMEGLRQAAADMTLNLGKSTEAAGESFVNMANKSINALSNLANAIKGGGVMDILSSAFNAFGAIAGAGAFGGKMKANFADFQPISGFRANGGPVSAGKNYIVGERGPEMFTASRSGYIHPNGTNDNGGRSARVEIVPSPYFDVVVDRRSAAVAAPMATRAAMGGSAMAQSSIARAGRRRIPGR